MHGELPVELAQALRIDIADFDCGLRPAEGALGSGLLHLVDLDSEGPAYARFNDSAAKVDRRSHRNMLRAAHIPLHQPSLRPRYFAESRSGRSA